MFMRLSLKVGESSSVVVMSSPSQNERDGTDDSYTLEQFERTLLDSPEPPEQHLHSDESEDELSRAALPELDLFIQTEQHLHNDESDDELPRDAFMQLIPDLGSFVQTDHLTNETVAAIDLPHQSKARSSSAVDEDRKRDREDDDSTTKRPIKRSHVSRKKKARDSSVDIKEAAIATSSQPAPSLETRVQPASKGRYIKRGPYRCNYCGKTKGNNHNLSCEFGVRRRKKKLVHAETQTPVPASASPLDSHERTLVLANHIMQGCLYVNPEEEDSDTRDSKKMKEKASEEEEEERKQSAVPRESAKKDQKEVPADKEDEETAKEPKDDLKPPPEEGNSNDSVGETAAV
jgi:hypothetical protein